MVEISPLFQTDSIKQKKSKQKYTVLTCQDILKLIIDYNIPITQETLDKLQENNIYYIEGVCDTVIR